VILGIVGSEQAKFTPETEAAARAVISTYIDECRPHEIVSGGCHLGGVDLYAEEAAAEYGIPVVVFRPATLRWGEPGGYKERNLRIAKRSDAVLCVTLAVLPPTYDGPDYGPCYHCRGRNPPHVKSGGCWTAWKCKERAWEIISSDMCSRCGCVRGLDGFCSYACEPYPWEKD